MANVQYYSLNPHCGSSFRFSLSRLPDVTYRVREKVKQRGNAFITWERVSEYHPKQMQPDLFFLFLGEIIENLLL